MTQTTYYEFNKPEGTDLVNPLVDTNPNWDIADSSLHELNERSVANATEIVTLGVHAISRLNTDTKFIKWIATANFTAGDTFTVDGLVVAASTPSGASLETNAYVTGSVVLAALNADNSAMTIYVSGTTTAADSERLGGELPAYYAKQSDMSTAETDITNLQNKVGNTSIVGIGDGTCTGAIDALNTSVTGKADKNQLGFGTRTAFAINTPAPSDGFVTFTAVSNSNAVVRILVRNDNDGSVLYYSSYFQVGYTNGFAIPIRKDDYISGIDGSFASSSLLFTPVYKE